MKFLFYYHSYFSLILKKNEYYVTNKRIISFNNISKVFKAIRIEEVARIEINDTKFHIVKKELNIHFNNDKGDYFKEGKFFKNENDFFPYLSFKHLEDRVKVLDIINEHTEFHTNKR